MFVTILANLGSMMSLPLLSLPAPYIGGEIVGPIFPPISHVDYGNHLARVHYPGLVQVQAARGDSRGSSKPHR